MNMKNLCDVVDKTVLYKAYILTRTPLVGVKTIRDRNPKLQLCQAFNLRNMICGVSKRIEPKVG
jgi:hypothetical protein